MPESPPILSVIMPVYNERLTLREIVKRVQAVPIDKEIIAVNDCSTDGSSEVLEELAGQYTNFRVIHQLRNQGKGAALRAGIRHAEGQIVLIQDADLEYDPNEYPHLIGPILDGKADVVYGSRFAGASRRVLLFWHTLGNKFLTLLSNMFSNLNLTDMETCYKAFRADVIKNVHLTSNRFGFEPEVTARVAQLKCRIYEVPITYDGRDYTEGKKIGWKDGVSAVWTIVKCAFTTPHLETGASTLAILSEARRFNRFMYETIAPGVGNRILEVGSGMGNLTGFLAQREFVFASDVDPHYLHHLRHRFSSRPNMQVGYLDLNDVPVEQMRAFQFDTVVCLNVLEHIERDEQVLSRLHELLAPGGRLVLLVPAHKALYGSLDKELGHYRRYTRAEALDKFRQAGFNVEQSRYFNAAGVVGWFLNARLLRSKHLPPFQVRVFDLLLPLFKLERFLPMPIGLSLIVVGQKGGVEGCLAQSAASAQTI